MNVLSFLNCYIAVSVQQLAKILIMQENYNNSIKAASVGAALTQPTIQELQTTT